MTKDEIDHDSTGEQIIERNGVYIRATVGATGATIVGPIPSTLPAEELEHAEADHE